jgi:hypothetical protein
MRNTKQLEKEKVVISVEIPVELYFRMKFEGERIGYRDMSKYHRDILLNHFSESRFEEEADDVES